jgi:hypothetical protein
MDQRFRRRFAGQHRRVMPGIVGRLLVKATSNLHDLRRTALLHPLLNRANCAGTSADEGRGASGLKDNIGVLLIQRALNTRLLWDFPALTRRHCGVP